MEEKGSWVETGPGFRFDFYYDAERQQRMAAKVEKIVVSRNRIDFQQLFPDVGDQCLGSWRWRLDDSIETQGVVELINKAVPIQFTIGGKRQAFQTDDD